MPPRRMEAAIVALKVGVQVASILPHAAPIQVVLALVQMILERSNNVSKNKEALRSLAVKAQHQALIACKFFEERPLDDQQPHLFNSIFDLLEEILTYMDYVNESSRLKNLFQVNGMTRAISNFEERLDYCFTCLMLNVLGSIQDSQRSTRQSYYHSESQYYQYLEIFNRRQLHPAQSPMNTRELGDGIRVSSILGHLDDNSSILIKQYESDDFAAAKKAFNMELVKRQHLSNVVNQIIGCSGQAEVCPYIVYRISPPDQRISFWNVDDPNQYALLLLLLPGYFREWKTNYGSIPIREEESHILADWLEDLTVNLPGYGGRSSYELCYSGDLAKLGDHKDTEETWERFKLWLSWCLLLWAPASADERIQTLVLGLDWETPNTHAIDILARGNSIDSIFDQPRRQSTNEEGAQVEVNGEEVIFGDKWYHRLTNTRETFAHRYYDEDLGCMRTEWIEWYTDLKQGYRHSACNCEEAELPHAPEAYYTLDQFVVTCQNSPIE